MRADFSAMYIYKVSFGAGCEKLRRAARRSGFYSLAVWWWLHWAVQLEACWGPEATGEALPSLGQVLVKLWSSVLSLGCRLRETRDIV